MARPRRKPSKNRRNKPGRQQGSGDTGRNGLALSLDDADFTYQSDRLYSSSNDPITRLADRDNGRRYAIEVELSDHFIVWTIEGHTMAEPNANYHIRMVLAGDFTYDSDGILSGGTIFNAAIDNTKVPGEGDSRRFYGQTYVAPAAGVKIGSPRTTAGWMSAVNEAFSLDYMMDEYGDLGDNDSEAPRNFQSENNSYLAQESSEGQQFYFAQIAGGLPAVRAFGQGRFFDDYWWNNPFSSNLV